MDADWSVELGADDPALEFPWSSPNGSQGYVDLSSQPQVLTAIPEAVAYPELAEFLRTINAASSPWLTVKCDVWIDNELGEAETIYDGTLKLCSYVDLIARETGARWSFERHEAWVKFAARKLDGEDSESISCEFIVRRCWYQPEGKEDPEQMTAGYYVTLYVCGYGNDEAEARARWAEGLRRVTGVIADLAP